ncbi:cytochrome P450 [Melanogaster broomeanus]|nr:cytochrome P450 [Melanogaster broomeanus]
MTRAGAFTFDILCGLAAHYWFNNHEPTVSWTLIAQIVVIPLPSALLLTNCSSSVGTAFFAGYTLFLTTLFASIVVYRLSPFHPLAKYPGPILCKVSQLWVVAVVCRGKGHIYRKQLHEQYGCIVRIGPNELSVTDKNMLPSILGTHGMPKGPLFEGRRMTPVSGKEIESYSLISSRDPQRHAILRKAWNKAFANSPLKDYEELMYLRARQLMDTLGRVCKEQGGVGRVDIATWIGYFSFDVMGDMAFGGGFELMRDENSLIILPATHIWTPIRAFGSFAFQRAKIRYHQELKRKDLFYHLIEAYHSDSQESPFTLIVSNSTLAIIAGSDTTASVLSNIIYYLLMNPIYLTRLREELDMQHSRRRRYPQTRFFVYNHLSPHHCSVRLSRGTGGKMIGTHYITDGTQVQVPPYVLHRDPKYFFPHPDDFWPDRWLLEASDSPDLVLDRSAFIPFSMGPANCVGKPLAMLELEGGRSAVHHAFRYAI